MRSAALWALLGLTTTTCKSSLLQRPNSRLVFVLPNNCLHSPLCSPAAAAAAAGMNNRRSFLFLFCRRFLVGGRLCGSTFKCLTDDALPLVDGLPQDLFVPIPEFRVDISSTELRAQKAIAEAASAATTTSST